MRKVIIYCDGACSGNPGPGGWGAILLDVATGKNKEISSAEANTTNNRMELTAALEALKSLKQPCIVEIVTDSQYLIKGITQWIYNWQKNNWQTANKKPVKNKELWQELYSISKIHQITYTWIKGHSGHIENERADELAVNAYKKLNI